MKSFVIADELAVFFSYSATMKAVRDGMQNITFDHYKWFSFFIIGLLPLERFQVAEVINKGRV